MEKNMIKNSVIGVLAFCALVVSGLHTSPSMAMGSGMPIAIEDPTPQLRLYVLQCGFVDFRGVEAFEKFYGFPESSVSSATQANPCFLVVNGDKALLWDIGLSDSTPATPTEWVHGIKASSAVKLKDQLTELGYTPDQIDYVAISHFHLDHIGNWEYFDKSKFLMQRNEWEAATLTDNVGYDKEVVLGVAARNNLILADGEYDVFGDGRVTLLSVPGHTAGSQALVVHLEKYGPVIITGDALHFREEITNGIIPTFNVSAPQSRESIAKMLAVQEEIGASLWVQHDPIQFTEWRLSPAYYE